MDNYLYSNARRKRQLKSSRGNSQKAMKSFRTEEINIFMALHGPNKIPRLHEFINLVAQPYLEATNRLDPTAPPKIYSLGEESSLKIVGMVQFKQLIDKKRKLYKITILSVKNEGAKLAIMIPKDYEWRFPLTKRRVFWPLYGSTFHMYYSLTRTKDQYRGVITKIHPRTEKDTFDQFIPRDFRP